ncbi:MAG TPA: RluA family pseudouridine synthase [Chitinophagales bacterium]|jgi:23S rRNA pseudouridine1911/1915/1917 synthase|nr:RluA family pseudouridine synthase [Chitinophagales bacterium]
MNQTEQIQNTEENEDELYEHHRFTIDKGQEPTRIDKFLTIRIVGISRNKIQNAIDAGNVLVNGKPVKANYKTRPLDLVQVVLPNPAWDYTVEPEDIPLEIIYEDDDVLLVNKKAGMVCHPGHGNFHGTLVHALMWHCKDLPQISGATRPGLVHRLDKNTSGIIIIGKTEHALAHLSKQFFDRTIKRHYIALVWGDLEKNSGRIECNVARNPNNRKVFMAVEDGLIGKHAVTHYEVIKRYGYVTQVKCKLETGRTHQIRVHMKYIGHTLFGDYSYGGDQILAGTVYGKYKTFIENCWKLMPYHALHAQSLGFIHPRTNEEMYFEMPLPENFKAVIDKWENYTKGFQL